MAEPLVADITGRDLVDIGALPTGGLVWSKPLGNHRTGSIIDRSVYSAFIFAAWQASSTSMAR
ncbi:hypothetical protein D3C84_1021350 [compost metagenome]